MDWFERLTGFREENYEATRAMLKVEGQRLRSRVNGRSWEIGAFEMVSLSSLRERAGAAGTNPGRLRVSIVEGDVRRLHAEPEYAGALFQVASQFNALEMTGPSVTPEDGVTRYQHDKTQGPACAIAAGAATIYRNYFVPIEGELGQTSQRQLDGLAALGASLREVTGQPLPKLWRMRNGYAMCSRAGLELIAAHLDGLDEAQRDRLRGQLAIGMQNGVEVTDATDAPGPVVSQAFCSALPVAYTDVPSSHWQAFATLVLEAAYEATIWAALENARRGGANIVMLTLLGGGAFGNESGWIFAAMRRALDLAFGFDLDARIVSYGEPARELIALVKSLLLQTADPPPTNWTA